MRSFVEFMIEQREVEKQLFGEDYDTISNNCDVSTLAIIWFTTAVKLAVEANNPYSEWGNSLNPWKYEVDAMLSAYYNAQYITAIEFCTITNTFYRWMRCNYRAKKPFKITR